MNLLHLRAFHAVATHGSFTRAAAALNVTQPTVSDQIKALESRYQVKLFERHSRRVEITELGQALFAITQRQFKLEADAEQLLATARGLAHGRLRVAAGGYLRLFGFTHSEEALELDLVVAGEPRRLTSLDVADVLGYLRDEEFRLRDRQKRKQPARLKRRWLTGRIR